MFCLRPCINITVSVLPNLCSWKNIHALSWHRQNQKKRSAGGQHRASLVCQHRAECFQKVDICTLRSIVKVCVIYLWNLVFHGQNIYFWSFNSQPWQFNISAAQLSVVNVPSRGNTAWHLGCAAGSWKNLVMTCRLSIMKSLILDKHGTSGFHPL